MSEQLPAELERVHMVGIGGAGMSGIARILLARGGQVSGSDAKESRGVLALRARGATVRIGHDASALDLLEGGPTAVVTTHAAIPKDNPELVAAHERGIPVLLRPAVLASLMRGHHTFLVSGTHGKTSTTSMLVVTLQHCGFDPSFAVGGELNESGTNAHQGSGDVFVAEADESDGSLLQYEPNVVIVTNVEADHLDFFGTPEAYTQVFDDFVGRIAPGGLLVVCLDDPGSAALARRVVERDIPGLRVAGYGSADTIGTGDHADGVPVAVRLVAWEAKDVGGVAEFHLAGEDAPRTVRLSVPGRHMALNALAALVAALEAGAPVDEAIEGLAGFGGVHRRFQYSGREHGVRVFDDYAHHPTEVRAVLAAAAELVAGEPLRYAESGTERPRVIVVFQPHLYSRTETFAEQFGSALDLADEVVVLDVYGAREEPIPGVSGALVAQAVSKPVHYQPDLSLVPRQVAQLSRPGDIVITMGAGDVTMLGRQILDALRSKPGRFRSGPVDGSGSGRP
ncbi:UDP-N-acetylmuramate--L-alanine ligase [Rhodococcus sp. HM1]|uniref:UDP-N-acetylmuramate--L-alanine ligase n=1 Tax=unclassified Rhodococcus (in: high G+C Gram-positive bacteria) TaxID=192944 RepID=UPI0018CFA4E5|nr:MULTISPECIES: UDP-N-acetylmuramate--L-alanine ligase [unclassified Rhodococcus (in: high G+C Gram-positive bacteria)]MBH0121795.1 UDP-N-acetylmuramate--L-alanine ligase [Rhodococcus sp. CX]MCK8670823.1 UDP-N-acetylmuramate--L-alanine ligase [Rhodococcus sp. HM1]